VNHRARQISGSLSSQQIKEIAALDDQNHYQNALRNILVPRVVSTQGWRNVQDFIVGELTAMGMEVELDSFQDQTPNFGKLSFMNIIGKLNPTADKFLVLSAHYDSKYFADQEFLGATGE
jgi:glutaminyl-peptide cyclotransferase